MYYLLNNRNGQYFCEFSEQMIALDTKDLTEAANFYTHEDADLLRTHISGKYQVVQIESVNNEN